jgi:hypothetical protein
VRWVRRALVVVLLLAPIAAVAALGAAQSEEGPDVLEPVEVDVAIGPYDTSVVMRQDFTGVCAEVTAIDRNVSNCGINSEALGFVLPFGDGEGDAEFVVVGLAPPEAASVRIIPDEGEPVAGELHPLDNREEQLLTGYWSFPAVAPEPPAVEVLDADGTVLMEL